MAVLREIIVGDNTYYYLYHSKKTKKGLVEYKELLGTKKPKDEKKKLEAFTKQIKEKKIEPVGFSEENLIELLEEMQEKYGYLPKDKLVKLAKELDIPGTEIYGVATFYSFFQMEKPPKYTIKVCDGTACHVRGSPKIYKMLKDTLDINPGETTKDGLFTVETVRCLGLCASAPLMVINEKLYPNLTGEKVKEIVEKLKEEKK